MIENKTIAAIASGTGGGIGVIRISGAEALRIADSVFKGKKSPMTMAGYTGALGKVFDDQGELDEAVIFVYKAPYSYTGENVCEISCHGGRYVMDKVLSAIIQQGAVPAAAGEFTKRAFLNGKMSLTQAESVINIIASENRQSLGTALEIKDGALFHIINTAINQLVDCAAHISAWIDYPEEDVEEVLMSKLTDTTSEQQKILVNLVNHYDKGCMIRGGITTAIVGSPNVGKSTLMNILAGYERSIVTDIAGTTRDVIQEHIRIGDLTLNISDTAGIRQTDDIVEQIGVSRSVSRLEQCQLVLAVFDMSKPLEENDMSLLARLEGKYAIGVCNKSDLETKGDLTIIKQHVSEIVSISAKNGNGIEELEEKIASLVGINHIDSSSILLANQRQLGCVVAGVKAIEEAMSALSFGQTLDAVSISIEEAIDALLELTGKKASTEVIDQVFMQFCVGK